MKKTILSLSLLTFVSLNTALAEEASQGEVSYKSPSGVEFKIDENTGKTRSIKAKAEGDMMIGDRRDQRSCLEKAELRAKNNIAKFLSEEIKSSKTLSDLEKSMSDANGQSVEVNRKVVETLSENISNNSQAILRGVKVISSEVVAEQKVCTVEVGMNFKTIKAAESLQRNLNQSFQNSSGGGSQSGGGVSTPIQKGGSFFKKSSDYDEF